MAMNPQELINKASELVSQYDNLVSELWKLEDEQIDQLLDNQANQLDLINPLMLYAKVYAERRKIAEKEEGKAKTLIKRIMTRSDLKDHESEDGKIKGTIEYHYETDMEKLPREYLMANSASIRSALRKDQTIDWITPVAWYLSITIR